ncbi:hypothetical protein [Deinococcus aluminii]|uniref:Uncharacterized protein n=1 Tax=Deinococcus aluminii TaxID=1656885 RepID=A0ABP9XH66_9DEIO
MQIDQERLEALRPQLEQHGVDTRDLPKPGTPEWDARVRDLNLKNPVLAQEFAALGYDPDELANSELVEKQASRAAARSGPLDRLKGPFRTKTVNGDEVPNTSLVRNILLAAGAAAVLGIYFLVPSSSQAKKGTASGAGGAAAVTAGSTSNTPTASSDDGVPPPEDSIPTNPLADAPVPAQPDTTTTDPTGMGQPVASPPDTLDVPAGLTSPAPPASAPVVMNVPPQTIPTQTGADWAGGPVAATSAGSTLPTAPAPVVIRNPGAEGSPPLLVRTSAEGRQGGSRGLNRTTTGTASGEAGRTRGLSGTQGQAGEAGQASATGQGGTPRRYGLNSAGKPEGSAATQTGLQAAGAPGGTAGTVAGQGSNPGDPQAPASGVNRVGLNRTAETQAPQYALASVNPRETAGGGQTAASSREGAQAVGLISASGGQNATTPAAGGRPTGTQSYGLSSTSGFSTAQAATGTVPSPSTETVGSGQASGPLPYQVGRPVPAKLVMGVAAVEGAEGSLPVYAESADGAVWRGTAAVDAQGRMRVTFDAVLQGDREIPLVADAYGDDGLLGIRARVRPTTPNLAANLLSGLASGVKSFAEAMINQRSVTVQSGAAGSVVTNSTANPPNFWVTAAGSTLGSFSLPQGKAGLVNVADVQPGAALTIVVRRAGKGE